MNTKNVSPLIALTLTITVLMGSGLSAQDDRFTLDVISPDVENGGVIRGVAGSVVTVHLQVQLTTTEAGLVGVVLPLGGEGADISFVTPGCDSTCANELYWRGVNNFFWYNLEGRDTVDPTFENTTGALAGAGPQGAGMSFFFGTNIITGFSYPAGTFTIIDIDVEVTIPTGVDPETVTIDLKNGIKGVGQPQDLTITSLINPDIQSAVVNGLTFEVSNAPPEILFKRGDSNNDGAVDISDAIHVLRYLFLGDDELHCQDASDSNDDELIDISDALHLLGVLHLGKPAIPPGLNCGTDDDVQFEDCPEGSSECGS